jgi:hypothetical protein
VDGILAQYVALALHGSARLAGRAGSGSVFEDANSTFHFVSNVRFEGDGRAVDTVATWLDRLAERGVRRLWLAVPSGAGLTAAEVAQWRDSRSFGGSSSAAIGIWDGTLLWQAGWRTLGGDIRSPHRRPWAVSYRGEPASLEPDRTPVVRATMELTDALRAAVAFADNDATLTAWVPRLTTALALGTADAPVPPNHPDLAPEGLLDLPRARLLASAVGAHVFGGMASWNDASFDDPDLARAYEDLSNRLFLADQRAFSTVVNA